MFLSRRANPLNPWVYEYSYGHFEFLSGKNKEAIPFFESYVETQEQEDVLNYLKGGTKPPIDDFWLEMRYKGLKTNFNLLNFFNTIPYTKLAPYLEGKKLDMSDPYFANYIKGVLPQKVVFYCRYYGKGYLPSSFVAACYENGEYPLEWGYYIPGERVEVYNEYPTLEDLQKPAPLFAPLNPVLQRYMMTPNAILAINPFKNPALKDLGIHEAYHSFNLVFKGKKMEPIFINNFNTPGETKVQASTPEGELGFRTIVASYKATKVMPRISIVRPWQLGNRSLNNDVCIANLALDGNWSYLVGDCDSLNVGIATLKGLADLHGGINITRHPDYTDYSLTEGIER